MHNDSILGFFKGSVHLERGQMTHTYTHTQGKTKRQEMLTEDEADTFVFYAPRFLLPHQRNDSTWTFVCAALIDLNYM